MMGMVRRPRRDARPARAGCRIHALGREGSVPSPSALTAHRWRGGRCRDDRRQGFTRSSIAHSFSLLSSRRRPPAPTRSPRAAGRDRTWASSGLARPCRPDAAELWVSIRAISSSASPWLGFTVTSPRARLSSRALTESRPSASTAGSAPPPAPRPPPSEGCPQLGPRQPAATSTSSRRPGPHGSDPVCPSLNVVRSWARAVGIVLLRGISVDEAPHRLQPERPGDHVEQQHVGLPALPGQRFGQDRRAERHGLIRVQVPQRRATEDLGHSAPHLGMRVEPPTSTTRRSPFALARVARAPCARQHVRSKSGLATDSNWSRVDPADRDAADRAGQLA